MFCYIIIFEEKISWQEHDSQCRPQKLRDRKTCSLHYKNLRIIKRGIGVDIVRIPKNIMYEMNKSRPAHLVFELPDCGLVKQPFVGIVHINMWYQPFYLFVFLCV
jgi:hypothetical protein